MAVHRDRTVKYDAFREKEHNWWRPKGQANASMGPRSVKVLVSGGRVTGAGKQAAYTV